MAAILNHHLADPPKVDLSCPDLFPRLQTTRKGRLLSFSLDIANQFYNIILPRWFAMYLLTTIAFANVSGPSQRQLMNQLGLRKRPRQSDSFQLHQQTMSIGLEWIVYVAHEIVVKIAELTNANIGPRLRNSVRLSRKTKFMRLRPGDALALHIIDDLNVVTSDVMSQKTTRCLSRLAFGITWRALGCH